MASVTTSRTGDGLTLNFEGTLDRRTIPEVYTQTMQQLRAQSLKKGAQVLFDLANVQRMDSSGVAFFQQVSQDSRARGQTIAIQGMSPDIAQMFKLYNMPGPHTAAGGALEAVKKTPLFERIADSVLDKWSSLISFIGLAADCFVWSIGGAARTKRVRKGAIWQEGNTIGVDSLPIVGLIAFLIGMVLALQAASQLRQFGADLFVANLVAVSMTREMGPLMTAIIIAGRSGASIAAEIATMTVNEEIESLQTMGLEPVRYVVVPKFQALTISMPALVMYANFLGILGGAIVAMFYMKLGVSTFFSQVAKALVLKDIITGLIKSVSFAWIIVLIASYNGFQGRGGPEGVGRSTTNSVVSSIFWVIVADAVFNIVFYF
jgi:phospholipid/cholesterol/gamma-HCH transport system permease protein